MKNLFYILSISLFLFSCSNKNEITKLETANRELKKELSTCAKSLNKEKNQRVVSFKALIDLNNTFKKKMTTEEKEKVFNEFSKNYEPEINKFLRQNAKEMMKGLRNLKPIKPPKKK